MNEAGEIAVSVIGSVAGVVIIYYVCRVLRQWHQQINREKWRNLHRKSLRGNFIMKYNSPIEEIYQFDDSKSVLGKGSFGVVVIGVHRYTGVSYAIKFIQKSSDKRYRIERELRLLKDVDHTNIVRLFAVYDNAEHVGFVMELCTGGHLMKLLDRQPKRFISEVHAKTIMRQLVSAIAHIHDRGICHRDIKLQNILMENYHKNAQIKLIDFGFGTRFVGATPLRTPCGTLYTTAPEVLRESYDERCDVWSGGVVAYVLLCGRRPFEALELPGALETAGKASVMTNILMGRYSFNHPPFRRVSNTCISFIQNMMATDYKSRWSARAAMDHPWLQMTDSDTHTARNTQVLTQLRRQSSMSALHQSSMLAIVFSLPHIKTSELRAMFQEFDTDHSGALSREEFHEAMKRMSVNLPTEDIDHLFDAIDVDNDHQISFTEFLAATLDPREVDIEELNKAFRLLDIDNKGYISKDDLHRVLAGKEDEAAPRRRNSEALGPLILNNERLLANIESKVSVKSLVTCAEESNDKDANSSDIEYSFDHGKKGIINSEIKRRFSHSNLALSQEKQSLIQQKIRAVMEKCDTDGDGVISYAEFLWAMADGDGIMNSMSERTGNLSMRGLSYDDNDMDNTGETQMQVVNGLRKVKSLPNILLCMEEEVVVQDKRRRSMFGNVEMKRNANKVVPTLLPLIEHRLQVNKSPQPQRSPEAWASDAELRRSRSRSFRSVRISPQVSEREVDHKPAVQSPRLSPRRDRNAIRSLLKHDMDIGYSGDEGPGYDLLRADESWDIEEGGKGQNGLDHKSSETHSGSKQRKNLQEGFRLRGSGSGST